MLNGLDLFSGIGGISLALSDWVATIAYCESDKYAQSVLLSRMETGDLRTAPIWDDVRSLSASFLPPIDIISGGFPCQDISVAGSGAGLEGERSGLYSHIRRLTSELLPRFVFLENVPAITVRGMDRILMDFTQMGYDTRWTIVSAAEVGACHRRDRWWLLAHAHGSGIREQSECKPKRKGKAIAKHDSEMADAESQRSQQRIFGSRDEPQVSKSICDDNSSMANTQSNGLEEPWEANSPPASAPTDSSWWTAEPDVGRVVDGLSHRVDRLRGLGNAVVPLQAKTAFERLMGIM